MKHSLISQLNKIVYYLFPQISIQKLIQKWPRWKQVLFSNRTRISNPVSSTDTKQKAEGRKRNDVSHGMQHCWYSSKISDKWNGALSSSGFGIYLPTVCYSHPLLPHNHLHHLQGEKSHPLHRLQILIHLSPLKQRKKEKWMKAYKNARQHLGDLSGQKYPWRSKGA